MIEGTTQNGFSYSIEQDALDDYELLEALSALDRGEAQNIVKVVDLLLGEEQKAHLFAHLRTNGRVSAKAVVKTVAEILENFNQGKNS